jgi:hypothetical protein
MSRTMTRRRYTVLSLTHAAEAAGFATACQIEADPVKPLRPSQRFTEKVASRIEGLRSALASISIL